MPTLDLVVLRTFLAVVETGTLAAAALRVGRSESAVSLQIKKLEETLGEAVFERTSRKLELTDAGTVMLRYARQLLDLNDEALQAAGAHGLDGEVSLGVPPDFAETWLPALAASFRRSHPGIKLTTRVDRSPLLQAQVDRNELDLAVTFAGAQSNSAIWSAELPMAWIGPHTFRREGHDMVSLAVFDPPCAFRAAAMAALENAGIGWNVAFRSPSLAAIWAAIDAGLGISVRTPFGVPAHVAVLQEACGLPPLPKVALAMHASTPLSAVGKQLQRVIEDGLSASLAGGM